MESIGRILLFMGGLLILGGLIFFLAGRLGLGKLPGDIVVERERFVFYFPVVTTLLISIFLTVLINLILRLFR